MTNRHIFHSTAYDHDINTYDGHECEIVRPLRPDEADEEVGPMFKVRFANGAEHDVFADELTPNPASES